MSRIIHDVTLTFTTDIPRFPNTPEPTLERLRSMDDGAVNNLSRLDTHVHFGTHVDAPKHFVADGYGMEAVPLEVLLGPCIVVDFPDLAEIEPADLEAKAIPAGTRRLIVKTRNSELWNDYTQGFRPDFVALTPAAADWVIERGIRLIGIDYLSIERFQEPGRVTHRSLLGAEVVLVEGLDLRGIEAGPYELVCMPLKLKGCDGAPARVALIEP
ncbi:MAG: cyclase family protein [Rhodospirillales bacterium]|nr:cyclase family protein [Rhodospirillales bacterium]